jgi:hypothetical protein
LKKVTSNRQWCAPMFLNSVGASNYNMLATSTLFTSITVRKYNWTCQKTSIKTLQNNDAWRHKIP